jgi:HAD superfamily hydrolase (TIGR01459 family)
MSIETIDGLANVADRYALFLIDQWGVLHNGHKAHDGAIETMQRLRAMGKKVVILSNSSKRIGISTRRMAEMGFTPDCYDHCVTSGEEVWRALNARSEPFYRDLGTRCVVFTWDGDRNIMEGLGLTEVKTIAEADFILNAGTRTGTQDMSDYDPILREAADRDLPMVCANPDFVSIAPDGSFAICPGTTARRYEEFGGRVDYRGKPHLPVYRRCFEYEAEARPALAIGDSLYHDIGGANRAGIDSILIGGGIHRNDLGLGDGDTIDRERLRATCEREGQAPTYAMPRFAW